MKIVLTPGIKPTPTGCEAPMLPLRSPLVYFFYDESTSNEPSNCKASLSQWHRIDHNQSCKTIKEEADNAIAYRLAFKLSSGWSCNVTDNKAWIIMFGL